MKNNRYFNFPIMMMQGVLEDSDSRHDFLQDLLYFHVQRHAHKLEKYNEYEETPEQLFQRSADYWNLSIKGNIALRVQRADFLINYYQNAKVFVGISADIFFSFFEDNKTDFEWECLVAFLALKSIVGNKPYCKSNNGLLYARMSGYERVSDSSLTLSRFRRDKIVCELENNWGLKYYSRYTKGFYFGFDITITDLIFEAEKRRKSNIEKMKNDEKKKALAEALLILNPPTP